MIRTYSRRLLSPFIGVLQVAEMSEARVLSLDGRNWEVQYARINQAQFRTYHPGVDPNLRFDVVATIENGALKTRGAHPLAVSDAIRAATETQANAVFTTFAQLDGLMLHSLELVAVWGPAFSPYPALDVPAAERALGS